ncbi:aspartate/glutamate racemase family protein [Romboutsia sp.]|uniref:aspartate/glutamate racemase family protein n=1 Tax=Romboutsia sp. TaxID=1965302 RepID=UPI003F2FBFC4
MKTIGLIGGMSWESSLEYYRIINEEVKNILGGSHSAKCLMYSFDFQEVEKLQHEGKWEQLEKEMILQSNNLKKAGADFIVICTNTMHLMAPQIEKATGLKVLHIADVTGEEIIQEELDKVALLGTKFTMEGTFYREILEKKYNIEVIIPSKEDREIVHNIIYNELVKGIISDFSRKKYLAIIKKLEKEGAQGVILGCTEIPLLVKQSQVSIPVFDTTDIHSKAAVRYALED